MKALLHIESHQHASDPLPPTACRSLRASQRTGAAKQAEGHPCRVAAECWMEQQAPLAAQQSDATLTAGRPKHATLLLFGGSGHISSLIAVPAGVLRRSSSHTACPSAGLHTSALPPTALKLPLQVPVGLPTGVSPEQAKGVIDYLKSNPEAAERHYMEAQRVLGQPGMASVIQAQQQAQQSPAYQQQLAQLRWVPWQLGSPSRQSDVLCCALMLAVCASLSLGPSCPCREDPELKSVFEDIEASGGKAMEKYWNDTELMTKIAARMQSVSLDGPATPPPEAGKAKKVSLSASLGLQMLGGIACSEGFMTT